MSFVEFLLSGLSDVSAWSQERRLSYLKQLKRTSIYLLGSAGLLFILLVFGVVARQTWLISAAVLIVGVAAGILLLLATPLAIPAVWAGRTFETVKTYVTFVAAALLWLLLFGLYLSIVPISSNPKAIVLVFLLASILALLWARFGLGPRIRSMYTSVVVIFLLTTVGFLFPKSFTAAGSLGRRLDEQIAEFLSNPSRFLAKRPESPAPVDVEMIPTLEFFNTVTGEPQYWYYLTATGEYQVYNNPGFHYLTGDSLRVVTREVATEILRWHSGKESAGSKDPLSTESSSGAPDDLDPLANAPVGSRFAIPDLSRASAVHSALSPSDLHLRRAVLDESASQGSGTFRIRTLPSKLSYSPVFVQIEAEVSPDYFLTAKVHGSEGVSTWELQGLGFHFLIWANGNGNDYLLYESEEREYFWEPLPFEIESGPVTMGLYQVGRHIRVYLNSRLVDSFELWEYPNPGRVGLFFKGRTDGGGNVIFSGLAVYDFGG